MIARDLRFPARLAGNGPSKPSFIPYILTVSALTHLAAFHSGVEGDRLQVRSKPCLANGKEKEKCVKQVWQERVAGERLSRLCCLCPSSEEFGDGKGFEVGFAELGNGVRLATGVQN